jgi:hypothetical protein
MKDFGLLELIVHLWVTFLPGMKYQNQGLKFNLRLYSVVYPMVKFNPH